MSSVAASARPVDVTLDVLTRALQNARLRIRECEAEAAAVDGRLRLHRAHCLAIEAYAGSVEGFVPPPAIEGFEPAPASGAGIEARLASILAAIEAAGGDRTADVVGPALVDISAALARIEAAFAASRPATVSAAPATVSPAVRPGLPPVPATPRVAPRPTAPPAAVSMPSGGTREAPQLSAGARDWAATEVGKAVAKALGTAVMPVSEHQIMDDPDVQSALAGHRSSFLRLERLGGELQAGAASGFLDRSNPPEGGFAYSLSPAARAATRGVHDGR